MYLVLPHSFLSRVIAQKLYCEIFQYQMLYLRAQYLLVSRILDEADGHVLAILDSLDNVAPNVGLYPVLARIRRRSRTYQLCTVDMTFLLLSV